MKPEYVIKAAAPAFGLRVRAKADQVTVSINDHGGRGWPWAVMFLPVVQVKDKLQVIFIDKEKPPPYQMGELFDVSHWMKQDGYTPPYTLMSERSQWLIDHADVPWPFDNDKVLVLLLYFQSPDVGEEPMQPANFIQEDATTTQSPIDWDTYRDEVTIAVNRCLQRYDVDALRGGLISRRPPSTPDGSGDKARAAQATSSDQRDNVTFSLASCQYPSDIFDHMPSEAKVAGPADASLLALGRELKENPVGPSLMLFLGDQVYVDATAGLFDPKIQDDRYRLPYERRGGSRGALEVMQYSNVDVHMIADDHEIIDNWEPGAPASKPGKSAIQLGKESYWKYQRFDSGDDKTPIWRHDIVHRGLPFFLGDTRTEREGRTTGNWRSANIMGKTQFGELCEWMVNRDYAALPKFVVTSSTLLPRRLAVARDPACALHSDAWDGYPSSLHELLAYACDHEVKGLVFLSGDEHLSNWVRAVVTNLKTGKQCTLHSVHSSALYAPYPFANAVPQDFSSHETYSFDCCAQGRYSCQVSTTFAPEGDGFALLTAAKTLAGWQLSVVFHGAQGPKRHEAVTLDLL